MDKEDKESQNKVEFNNNETARGSSGYPGGFGYLFVFKHFTNSTEEECVQGLPMPVRRLLNYFNCGIMSL